MPAKLGQVVAEDAISRLGLRPPSGFVVAIDESQRLLVGVTHDEAWGGFFDGPGGGKTSDNAAAGISFG